MKKTVAILLATLLMAVSFAGCFDVPDGSSSSGKESQSVPESSSADLSSKEGSEESSQESEGQSSVIEPESQPSDSEQENEETSQSSEESEEEEESSKPSIGVNFTVKNFNFQQDDGSLVTVELAVPDSWYGYDGDISLFRDTDDYEEIKVAEASTAKILESADDINQYISEPGYTGATVMEEKMYTGNSGSSIYYYKTEAAPMGGMHEIEVWYPCFYYILMPDNTFVNLVFYALDIEDTEDFELFDTIVDSLVVKTAPAESQE